MKKLLLFGILTLLGIGSSFGDFSIQYYDLSGDNNFFNIGISMGYYNNPVSNYDLNGNSFSPYFLAGNCYDSLDISCFSPVSSYTMSRNFIPVIRGYYSSNGNNLLFNYYNNISVSSALASYFFPVTSYSIPTSNDVIDVSNGVFARILSNDSFCFSSGVLANTGTFCTPNFVQIFANYPRTISSLGTINDSLYSGVNYYKGPVSPAIGNGYSFMFVDGEGRVSDGTITHLSGDFHFRSIYFNGSDIITLNRFLVLKLNSKNYRYNSNSNYNVIALAFDSNYIINSLGYKEYPIFYSIYSCPISSSSVYDCSFVEGGDTNQYFSLGFTGTDSLSYYLTNPSGVKYLDNSYVSNTNTLTLGSFSLVLDSTAGDNILDYFPNPDSGGNGNQSTGSIAINTGFLDLCLNNLEFGELNSYLCNKLFNGNNLVLIPGQTGYYLSYGYDENGNLRFWITYQEDLELQMSGYIWEQDESGNWYTYFPEEINSGVDNSSGLKDYFNNWFEHGVFFSCPFRYTDSYYREFKLFGITHFVPKLGQSFLYPIYCMGAGFREGKNIDFFSGVNLGLESQLLSSPVYNYLYRLFDLILSVLIMFFIIKIYHLLN